MSIKGFLLTPCKKKVFFPALAIVVFRSKVFKMMPQAGGSYTQAGGSRGKGPMAGDCHGCRESHSH